MHEQIWIEEKEGKNHIIISKMIKKYFNSFYIIALSDFSKMRMNRL